MGLRFILLFALALIAACNPPADYALVGSAYVPSTHGDVNIEGIDKDQILVTVTLDRLPPPERIEVGLTHYVVWFSVPGELPVRQKTLDYEPETQVGRASIPTSLLEFELQITAENSETPQQPSDLLVTSQKVREK